MENPHDDISVELMEGAIYIAFTQSIKLPPLAVLELNIPVYVKLSPLEGVCVVGSVPVPSPNEYLPLVAFCGAPMGHEGRVTYTIVNPNQDEITIREGTQLPPLYATAGSPFEASRLV